MRNKLMFFSAPKQALLYNPNSCCSTTCSTTVALQLKFCALTGVALHLADGGAATLALSRSTLDVYLGGQP